MANQPSLIPSAWAANNSTTETIPATTTESGKASWDQGFPVETSLPLSEGGIPPKYGDFNGILNVLSQFCLFAQAGGQFSWSSTLSYSVGSIVVGSDGSIYRAVQATTNVNPVGDTSGKWERIVSKSDIDDLEADIQTAMTNAENAVSNASAAQSAVSTLDANVVKLSGNQTVGGVKTFTSNVTIDGNIVRSANTGEMRLSGGTDASTWASGASLSLYGSARSTSPGTFILAAGTSTTVYSRLIGQPDGTLQWVGKEFVYTSGDQTITGQKTINTLVVTGSGNLRKTDDTHDLWLCSGTGNTVDHGAYIGLYGASNSGSYPGVFQIATGKVNNQYAALLGKPDGTLTWDGNNVITAAGGNMTGPLIRNEVIARSGATNGAISIYSGTAASDGAGIWLYGKNASTRPSWVLLQTYTTDYHALVFDGTAFYPTGNSTDLGKNNSTNRWKNEYFQTNPNVSSDERIKSSISSIPDDVLDAWADVNWSQFQMNDAIEEKGINNARLHTGVVAQRVRDAFLAHDLDATRYGLFCYDEWDAKSEEHDEKGEVISEAVQAGNQFSIRYGEAFAMEAAYQRRRADRAEARITTLERRLDEMEAVLASLLSPVGDETYAEPEQEQDAEREGEE